jgi:hypothetical protein
MTPQSLFMVVAPVARDRESALRALLDTMNSAPGLADPHNALLPFGDFDCLHFARLVLLVDDTLADVQAYGLPVASVPRYLALMGECDGPARDCLAEMAHRSATGLNRIFSHCEGFDSADALLPWMLAHDRPPIASYVNRVGRTAVQIREEDALQRALSDRAPRAPVASGEDAQRIQHELAHFVRAEQAAGRLKLTPPAPTPSGWQIAEVAHALALPVIGIVLLPIFLALLPLLLVLLRMHETGDPVICPRPQAGALLELLQLEDRDVTNQYTAIGSVKPGLFRRWLLTLLLVLVDYASRHVFTRGYLARVQTIHFARWVFLDDKTRMVFTSNYDGSHQAYMDDFINKVAWGLNLTFSNGVGWPRTRWLVLGGARIEQAFKYYQRRHQIPTQVWYKAYPGLALVDLERNRRIREGLERASISGHEALAWLRLL